MASVIKRICDNPVLVSGENALRNVLLSDFFISTSVDQFQELYAGALGDGLSSLAPLKGGGPEVGEKDTRIDRTRISVVKKIHQS